MAYIRSLSRRSNLLTRRCHPSIDHILHSGDDRRHNSIDKVPYLQGIHNFSQERAFGSGSANSSLLGSPKDRRCIDFSLSPTIGASFCRHMSTIPGEGSEKIELMTDVADVLSDATVQAVASQAPAVNEVAVAAADSFLPVAIVQFIIDGFHAFAGLHWWVCLVLATRCIRLAALPLVINQTRATSKLRLLRPRLEAIKHKIQDGDVDMHDGNKQMQMLLKEYGASPFAPMKGLFIQGPRFICFFLVILNMAEKVLSFVNGGAYWSSYTTSLEPLYIIPALAAYTFWITVEAIFSFWITFNLFFVSFFLALKVPAVKKLLGIPEMPVVSGQRISANAVMSQRIKTLEKQVNGGKRSSKKR